MHTIKIFGERNSGTTFVAQFLKLNFDVNIVPGTAAELGKDSLLMAQSSLPGREGLLIREAMIDDIIEAEFEASLGWKHSAPQTERIAQVIKKKPTVNFLFITKNPYAWVLSLFKRPYHNLLRFNRHDLETFILSPWLTVRRDNAPAAFASPVSLWNYKVSCYLRSAQELDGILLRYEDLVISPENAVSTICAKFDCSPPSNLRIPLQSTKGEPKSFGVYRDYCRRQTWLRELSPRELQLIGRQLDNVTMKRLDYPLA
jgi:hypothetical protein